MALRRTVLDWTAAERRRWLTPLASWIGDEWLSAGVPTRLLDVGCGDLLLATLLPPEVVVDGLDISPCARSAARATLVSLRRDGQVVGTLSELGDTRYDGIVLSSVLQYLPDQRAVHDLISSLVTFLAPGATGIVCTDLVGEDRSRRQDALDTWRFLRERSGWARSAAVLSAAAVISPGRLLTVAPNQLAGIDSSIPVTSLGRNLSALRVRRSCVVGQLE